ncbi:DinB family protein [Sutcliffiella rhizosphaerae]|uniref:Damage-inducible protein DinB n=1 Tax=Sutcliffiella rhizosphaerae TaxID=2880967 RepID=A0ABM8YJS5_9BACI|nr:DinB family protein [Sutcliffiella rhizosphaerae]CAG9620179.1 putative protein YizA [Sutcliffiella rhizosphaerae]
MQKLFQYNWQVREDWFNWCETVPEADILKERVGGVGGVLHTLFHIVDVEYSWILNMKGEVVPDVPPFKEYASLHKVREFSREYHHKVVRPFVYSWKDEMEKKTLLDTDSSGQTSIYKQGEIMRHILAHEIHHIGQLSIWAREIGKKPISANFIDRGLS